MSFYLYSGGFPEVRGDILDLSRPSPDHFWQLWFSGFRTHFCSIFMNLDISAQIAHFGWFSLAPRTKYCSIFTLRASRKSMWTLWSCPDFLLTISGNFQFWIISDFLASDCWSRSRLPHKSMTIESQTSQGVPEKSCDVQIKLHQTHRLVPQKSFFGFKNTFALPTSKN